MVSEIAPIPMYISHPLLILNDFSHCLSMYPLRSIYLRIWPCWIYSFLINSGLSFRNLLFWMSWFEQEPNFHRCFSTVPRCTRTLEFIKFLYRNSLHWFVRTENYWNFSIKGFALTSSSLQTFLLTATPSKPSKILLNAGTFSSEFLWKIFY